MFTSNKIGKFQRILYLGSYVLFYPCSWDIWKTQLFFYGQFKLLSSNYKTIITTIYKFGQKNLQIDVATYFWSTSLPLKNLIILTKWDHTLFTNRYISQIVSYNSSQSMRLDYLIIFSNSYGSQIWTEVYVDHNNTNCQIKLVIIM